MSDLDLPQLEAKITSQIQFRRFMCSMFVKFLPISVFVLFSIFVASPDTNGEVVSESNLKNHWRTANRCGVNVGYLLLRLAAKNPLNYEKVCDQLNIGVNGTKLVEIRDMLKNNKIGCRIVKATPDALTKVRVPAIAHMNVDDSAVFDVADRGHYALLFSVGDVIRYVDGTTVEIRDESLSSFQRNWTGYLLVLDQEEYGVWGLSYRYISYLTIFGILVGAVFSIIRRRLLTLKESLGRVPHVDM